MVKQAEVKKIALIGAGKIGIYHLRAYKKIADTNGTNIQIVGFSKTTKKGVEEMEKLLVCEGIFAKGYDNYEEMIKETSPDIVDICSSPEAHLKNLECALKHGVINCFCEKPVAPYTQLEEAKQFAEIAKNYGTNVAINMNMLAVREAIRYHFPVFGELENKVPFTIEWNSAKIQSHKERIEDLLIHCLSVVDNVDPQKITEETDDYVKIGCNDGRGEIILGNGNGRKWTFKKKEGRNKGVHAFSYAWSKGSPFITYTFNENKQEEICIEDPLKTSHTRVIYRKPLATLDKGIECLEKTARILR